MKGVKCIFLILFSIMGHQLNAQAPFWRLIDSTGQFVLELKPANSAETAGITDLKVFVGEKKEWPGSSAAAVLGKVSKVGETLTFQPVFPFRKGVAYTAFWNVHHRFSFTIPHTGTVTKLEAIYPSGQSVPANLLKIYLHFSAPMGEGRAYEHLTLINTVGDTIRQPFVPLQPELWSEDRRRLTLWLDPGRVKRGLLSHETHGVVLMTGKKYRLQIHPDWKDASGQRLGKSYQKTFQVIHPDYRQPRPDDWTLQLPKAGSSKPLIIDFGEPMDQALASRHIQIQQRSERSLTGTVLLKNAETQWYFYPESSWKSGTYTVVINSSLEDLAGNNLNRSFDREIIEGSEGKISAKDFQALEFTILRTE